MIKDKYTSKNIKYIKDIDHIRLRPSMYIGDININGLHQLIYEIINKKKDSFGINITYNSFL